MPRFDKQLKGGAETGDDGEQLDFQPAETNSKPQTAEPTADATQVDVKKLKEDENQKKREEHFKLRLKELQQEEQRFSRYNKLKIQEVWLAILRQTKAEELKKQIDILSQNHDRQVERKDAIIQMMYRDLSEAEEQYKFALRTHLQHIDELMMLHQKKVQSLEEEFRISLDVLKKEFDDERVEIEERHREQVLESEEIRQEMHKRAKKLNETLESEYLQTKESIRNKYSEALNVMSMTMEDKIKRYQEQIKQENIAHCENMDAKYTDYIVKRGLDDSTTEEIQKQTYRIKLFEESLAHWKAKWLNNLRECEERNKKLTNEKNALNKHFKELKKKMEKFRTSESKRLKELVMMSRQTMKELQGKVERAERILKLAELNRKMETERERFMPFEHFDRLENLDQQMAKNEATAGLFGPLHMEGGVSDWEQLGKFYSKCNKVILDKAALEQEKQHLVLENQKLRQALKEYLDGISVNEDVLNARNPLLIVESMNSGTGAYRSGPPKKKQEVLVNVNNGDNNNKVKV